MVPSKRNFLANMEKGIYWKEMGNSVDWKKSRIRFRNNWYRVL